MKWLEDPEGVSWWGKAKPKYCNEMENKPQFLQKQYLWQEFLFRAKPRCVKTAA